MYSPYIALLVIVKNTMHVWLEVLHESLVAWESKHVVLHCDYFLMSLMLE